MLERPNTYTNVLRAGSALIARVVKVTWAKDMRERTLLKDMAPFFEGSLFCQKAGLEIMTEVVVEMNQFIPCEVSGGISRAAVETKSSHRPSSATFRETIHLPLAQRVFPLLPRAEEAERLPPERISVTTSALGLLTALLSADYGGSGEGAGEEAEMAMLPSEWAPLAGSPALVTQLAALWGSYGGVTCRTQNEEAFLATRAAETLLALAAVRRSLFPAGEAAAAFYAALYAALRGLLAGKHLECEAFHSLVAQLAAKFKVNVQLGEMVKFPAFPAFFRQLADFAAASLRSRGYLGDFAYSLLLWSRLLEAVRFTSAPVFSYLPEREFHACVHGLCHAFVWTAVEEGEKGEEALEALEQLLRVKERVATLLTFDYEAVLEWTAGIAERALLRLRVLLDAGDVKDVHEDVHDDVHDDSRDNVKNTNDATAGMQQSDRRRGEGVSDRGGGMERGADGDDAAAAAVQRLAAARGNPSRGRLLRGHRVACAAALPPRRRRRSHRCLPASRPVSRVSHARCWSTSTRWPRCGMRSETSTHSLGDYKLRSLTQSPETPALGSRRSQAFAEFFALLDPEGPPRVFQTLLDFLLSLLAAPSPAVADPAVRLLAAVTANPHTQGVLLALPAARLLVARHYTLPLAALETPHPGRFLTGFYAAVTQLLLTHATPGDLEQFCLPLLRDLQALQDASPRESDRFCAAMRKVTGVVRACVTERAFQTVYDMLWEWGARFTQESRGLRGDGAVPRGERGGRGDQRDGVSAAGRVGVAQGLAHQPATTARGVSSAARCRRRRCSSSAGRRVSRGVTCIGWRNGARGCRDRSARAFPYRQTPAYPQAALKTLCVLLVGLTRILEGNFVSFGAMLFYHDDCVLRLLTALAAVLAPLELSDLAMAPKLMHAVFDFLRALFASNMLIVAALPRDLFPFFCRLLIDAIACDGTARRC